MGLKLALIRKLINYSIQSQGLPICWRYRRKEDSLPKHCPIQREFNEVCSIGPSTGKPNAHKLQEELIKESEAIGGEWTASVTPAEPMFPRAPPIEKKLKTKELSMKAAAHITAGVKKLLLLDPP